MNTAAAAATLPDHQEAAGWPYQSYLELGALKTAVPCARLHTRLVLEEWGLTADSAELIVSELVTNAFEHGLAGIPATIKIWLCSDGSRLVIYVWDGSSLYPVRKDAGLGEDSGRGLMIVEALSTEWGCCAGGAKGKVVWVLVGDP
jgi:two-component sensor histidine kinase